MTRHKASLRHSARMPCLAWPIRARATSLAVNSTKASSSAFRLTKVASTTEAISPRPSPSEDGDSDRPSSRSRTPLGKDDIAERPPAIPHEVATRQLGDRLVSWAAFSTLRRRIGLISPVMADSKSACSSATRLPNRPRLSSFVNVSRRSRFGATAARCVAFRRRDIGGRLGGFKHEIPSGVVPALSYYR